MKVEFRGTDPCQEWQAVSRMLKHRADLPADVTLVVEANCLHFLDPKGEPLNSLPPGQWVGGAIHDIDTMLALLAWIEKEFAVPVNKGRFGCPVRGWRRADIPRR